MILALTLALITLLRSFAFLLNAIGSAALCSALILCIFLRLRSRFSAFLSHSAVRAAAAGFPASTFSGLAVLQAAIVLRLYSRFSSKLLNFLGMLPSII